MSSVRQALPPGQPRPRHASQHLLPRRGAVRVCAGKSSGVPPKDREDDSDAEADVDVKPTTNPATNLATNLTTNFSKLTTFLRKDDVDVNMKASPKGRPGRY